MVLLFYVKEYIYLLNSFLTKATIIAITIAITTPTIATAGPMMNKGLSISSKNILFPPKYILKYNQTNKKARQITYYAIL